MGTTGRNRSSSFEYDPSQGYGEGNVNFGKPNLETPANELKGVDTLFEEGTPAEQAEGAWWLPSENAAAASAISAAEEEARIEQENEDKRRAKDAEIRDAELEKQQDSRSNQQSDRRLYSFSFNDVPATVDVDTGEFVSYNNKNIENERDLQEARELLRSHTGSLDDAIALSNARLYYDRNRGSNLPEEQQYAEMASSEALSEVEGYPNLMMRENGQVVPKGGYWTDEAIDEQARAVANGDLVASESAFSRIANAAEENQNANELEEDSSSPWEEYERIANTVGPSQTDAVRLDAARQKAERESGQTYEEYQASRRQGQQGQQSNAGQRRSEPSQQEYNDFLRDEDARRNGDRSEDDEPTSARSVVDRFFRESFFSRNRMARRKNKAIRRMYDRARRFNPGLTLEEFLENNDLSLDQEAFENQLRPENPKGYRRINEYEQGRALREEGQTSDIEDYMERRGIGTKIKEHFKLWRLLDQTTWDMRIGFFHVGTERVYTDSNTGERRLGWSRRVEDAISQVMDDFNGSGIDGERTVFRLVRLYATMAIDRQGKMFNMNQDEWYLTQQEFIDICNCIHRSIVMWGHPFVAPAFLTSSRGVRKTLRGTDMFPSGVVPRVVAEAITGEGSAIRFPKNHPRAGEQMTADELINAAREEWLNRTQPTMNANLVNSKAYKPKQKKRDKIKLSDGRTAYVDSDEDANERNLMAQRIAIENALQAFARLDGVDATTFGSAFNIDAAEHYRLWEYQDSLIEYAAATNGNYDSDAVSKRNIAKLEAHRSNMREHRNRKQVSALNESCNLMASGIKTNALFWNLPVRFGAIAERGWGNFQTWVTERALRRMYANADAFAIPDDVSEAFHTREGYDTIDAAYTLLEIGGPGALMDFSTTNKPMNQEEVMKYLNEYILRQAATESAYKVRRMRQKLDKVSQKILTGGHAFKHSTVTNFLNALMISNQAMADTQSKLAAAGAIDTYAGVALTGSEMSDVFRSHNGDVAWFFSEIVGTTAGRDALIMMNANNISQFNVLGYSVNKMLRDHGIGNAAITAFLDSFPSYGVNFLYSMLPMSRTITYLGLKVAEDIGSITAADFAMGGGFGESDRYGVNHSRLIFQNDPGFYNGLKMNLMFDCLNLAKWGLCGILIGGVLWLLGFDPPDDEDDILNISKWKIGKNVGLGLDTDEDGEGNGVEIELCFWTNDLTQWGMPIAYAFATYLSIPDGSEINGISKRDIMRNVFSDSIADMFSGNVVLDVIDCIKNWGTDMIDIDKAMKDPTHEASPSPFFGLSELMLNAFGKIVPGAPLYKAWGKSAFLRGPEADMFTTNKVYDKDSKWAIEVGKTDYIDDPMERLIRKYSAGNWLLAAIMNGVQMATGGADKGTGYFWHQMPTRTKSEPMALALAELQKMDYDNLPEGSTFYSYRAQRTEDIMNYIRENYTEEGADKPEPELAIRDSFFILGDIRDAALNTLFSELNALENEWDTRCELEFTVKDDAYYDALRDYNSQKNEIWDWINDWFKNPDIPTWMENYKQVLTDWDVTYYHADGTPANGLDAIFDPTITEEWRPKGNNPTNMVPWGFTVVNYNSTDKVERGAGGQTVPYWVSENSPKTMLGAIGDEVIKVGRDAGLTVNDVYYGKEFDGERWHEGDETIGERSWYFDKQDLPESLRAINQETCDGGIYGDLGKKKTDDDDDGNGNDSDNSNGSRISFYPRSSYGRGSRSYSGSNYSPKIYSSRVYNSKLYNSRAGSVPRISNSRISDSRVSNSHAGNMRITGTRVGSERTNPDAVSVNNDRATGMSVRTPQDARTTYLNPNFETKGSREAYKRQDI